MARGDGHPPARAARSSNPIALHSCCTVVHSETECVLSLSAGRPIRVMISTTASQPQALSRLHVPLRFAYVDPRFRSLNTLRTLLASTSMGGGRSSTSANFQRLAVVTLGDGWPNLPRKCQPNSSLRSREIKDFAVFSGRQPDISGFVSWMAI